MMLITQSLRQWLRYSLLLMSLKVMLVMSDLECKWAVQQGVLFDSLGWTLIESLLIVRNDLRSVSLRLIVHMLIRYLANLSTGRLILWCYFIWYCVVLVRYFDPSPRLWLTSLGLSGIIGFALYISTTAGSHKVRLEFWPTFRLFLMPFCVSSFSALVKGKGFVLIFSPKPAEILTAVGLCAFLCAMVAVLKRGRSAAGLAPRTAPEATRRQA